MNTLIVWPDTECSKDTALQTVEHISGFRRRQCLAVSMLVVPIRWVNRSSLSSMLGFRVKQLLVRPFQSGAVLFFLFSRGTSSVHHCGSVNFTTLGSRGTKGSSHRVIEQLVPPTGQQDSAGYLVRVGSFGKLIAYFPILLYLQQISAGSILRIQQSFNNTRRFG